MGAMERDYYYPELANRDTPRVWNDSGAPYAWNAAKEKAKSILESHHPVYIDPAIETAIRNKFNILS